MFVCAPCHAVRFEVPGYERHLGFASLGVCEFCRKQAECYNCRCLAVREPGPDYVLAEQALRDLRRALTGMPLNAAGATDITLEKITHQMLDTIDHLVMMHKRQAIEERERAPIVKVIARDGKIEMMD